MNIDFIDVSHKTEYFAFADAIKDEFQRLYDAYKIADVPDKKKPDMIDAIWEDIYDIVFKPTEEDVLFNNSKSKLIPYKVDEVEAVVKMFIKLNRLYGGVIKYNQFSELTGLNRYTIDLWHKAHHISEYIVDLSIKDMQEECNNIYIINNGNGDVIEYRGNACKSNNMLSTKRFDVKKKIQQAMQDSNTNGLSQDTMGHMGRANHDEDMGKLYEDRSLIRQEQVKRVLSVAELPHFNVLSSSSTIGITDNMVNEADKSP